MTQTRPLYTQIQELYMKCYPESSPHFIKRDNALKYILQLLAQFEIVVEQKNEEVVGCVIFQKYHNILLDVEECFIHEWFIDMRHRKKSVGARLYKKLRDKAKDMGCKRLRGFSYNREMIRTIENHNEAKQVAKLFEKDI